MRDPKLAHILVLNDPLDELKIESTPLSLSDCKKFPLKRVLKNPIWDLKWVAVLGGRRYWEGRYWEGGPRVVNKTILLKLFFTFSLLQFPFHSGNS